MVTPFPFDPVNYVTVRETSGHAGRVSYVV